MKKIILLLLLPLTVLMAIDFTMTRDGLIAPSSIDNSIEDTMTTSSTPATTTSSTPATTTSSAPATTTSSAPATTTSSAPATTTSSTPATTTSSAPATTTSSAPATTTSSAPATTTSSAPATTTSSAPATTTVTSGTNTYLEPVNLPECDASNPEVQFIRNNADWSTINSSTKRIFCVSPGDYRSLRNIKVTTSGTAEKRRYIILNNGNDLHPGKLDISEIANFSLDFVDADYWVLDRAAAISYNDYSYILNNGSSHNIFNRVLVSHSYALTNIKNHANYNTIQNSRIDTMTYKGFAEDVAAINIMESGRTAHVFTVLGTKIINNEFVNAKPGRLNRFPEGKQITDFSGTIFDSNTVEYNKDIRTDGKGNLDPNGDHAAGECTGFSTKGGSNDVNKPVILSNNHVWGFRPNDPTMKALSNKGIAFLAYMGSNHVHIKDNVIFDGTTAIALADRYEKAHGAEYAVVTGNLIVDCGARPDTNNATSLQIGQAWNSNMSNNTVINPIGYHAKVWYNFEGNYVGDNIIVNPDMGLLYKDNNAPVAGLDTNVDYETAAQGGYTEDYSFTTDKFTNNPRVITLENVLLPN